MFKNLSFFNIVAPVAITDTLPLFTQCAPSQEQSAGFVPPRGEAHGPLIETVAGQHVMRLMVERKTVPGDVLQRRVAQRADEIEQVTGRRPGKKEMRDIKESIKLEMLPVAFPKRKATWVWIDHAAQRLLVDTTSSNTIDLLLSLLVKHIDGFVVREVHTATSPTAAMSNWLDSQEPPSGFSVDRKLRLEATDASRAVVRYEHHPLDLNEIRQHITEGKLPVEMAMTFDERVSFVLDDRMRLRSLQFQDGVFEDKTERVDAFDADVAIATGEVRRLIPALLEALGGEVVLDAKLPDGDN